MSAWKDGPPCSRCLSRRPRAAEGTLSPAASCGGVFGALWFGECCLGSERRRPALLPASGARAR